MKSGANGGVEFNVWLHGVFPVLGALAFLGPLYYQCRPLPDYPMRYANWFATIWIAVGVAVTAWLARTRRQALVNAERIFVEDETIAPPAPEPV